MGLDRPFSNTGFNPSIKSIISKSYPHKTKAISPEVVLRSAPTQDKG